MEKERNIPCVTIVGHIDHGKTTLLEALSKTSPPKEAGGITQHIRVFPVKSKNGLPFSFLDTPGHKTFSDIRKRAIDASDVAVLIVSAEEGVKEQTKESFKTLSSSSTPFLVAITKTDSPAADIDRTKKSLSEAHIFVEGMGGDIPVVEISSKKKEGLDSFLEILNLLIETSTIEKKEGHGIILDVEKEKRGRVKTVILLTNNALSRGDYIQTRSGANAKALTISDTQGNEKETYHSGEVITVYGIEKALLGEQCFFYKNKKDLQTIEQKKETPSPTHNTQNEKTQQKKCIIKAQHMSSLQAMRNEIEENDISIHIIKEEVGEVTEKDVQLAITTNADIIAFGVGIDTHAEKSAAQNNIHIHTTDVIYTAIEILKNIHTSFIKETQIQEVRGVAKIIRVFKTNQKTSIYGARIQSGMFEIKKTIHIMRAGKHISEGIIQTIQQKNKECSEVEGEKTEFAFSLQSENTIELGDTIHHIQVS